MRCSLLQRCSRLSSSWLALACTLPAPFYPRRVVQRRTGTISNGERWYHSWKSATHLLDPASFKKEVSHRRSSISRVSVCSRVLYSSSASRTRSSTCLAAATKMLICREHRNCANREMMWIPKHCCIETGEQGTASPRGISTYLEIHLSTHLFGPRAERTAIVFNSLFHVLNPAVTIGRSHRNASKEGRHDEA